MPPALRPQLEMITLEQYEALPENRRAANILYNYIKSKKGSCQVFSAPFDVKLSDHPLTIVQPDIMIICDKEKL